jgi:hypothetical protein
MPSLGILIGSAAAPSKPPIRHLGASRVCIRGLQAAHHRYSDQVGCMVGRNLLILMSLG